MLEINDYSSRRGVLVPLLPKIHALIKENAEKDKLANIAPPEHIVTWTQKMRKLVVDINRRFLIALDGANVAGLFFYRVEQGKVFIEDVQIAWMFRNNTHVIEGFIKKLEYDPSIKEAEFYASERIKTDHDKELLAAKGFVTTYDDGWEKLGTLSQATGALKIRYNRGSGA